jgi:KaiC/GvpD/RAD55 family RecA-like ATPase
MIVTKGKNNGRNDLGYLGEDFQFRLIKAFMDDHSLFKELLPFIDQNCFTNTSLKTTVGFLKEFVEKQNYIPSYDLLSIQLANIVKDNIELEKIRETIKEVKRTTVEGVDLIKKDGIKFFRQQQFIRIFKEGLLSIEKGIDIEDTEIEKKLQKTMNIGKTEKIWTTVFEDMEDTLSEDLDIRIPMGINEIDEYLEGGFIKGNLAVIAAGSGIGKTTLSSSLAANAATCKCEQNNNEGFKVLQIFFEDKVRAIRRKHFGKITGIEAKNLTKKEYIELVKEQVESYEDKELIENNLRLGKFRTGELTVAQLRNYINNIVQSGFQPDVILIDYFECLVNPRVIANVSEWNGETQKMRELENLTEDFNALVAVTTQGTKDSAQGMLLTLDKISGAAGKGQVAHIVITINKTEKDKEDNRATIFIPKFREGKSGRSFNVCFNNGTCQIEVDKFFDSIDDLNEAYAEHTNKLKEDIKKEVFYKKK